MKKNIIFTAVFSAVIIICAIAFFFFLLNSGGGTAEIYKDGVLIETIDLNNVKQPYEIPIDGGHNIALAENGKISMKSADCPDGLCVKQGAISTGAYPIVCLPNKVVIKIRGAETELDGVAR